MKFDYIEQYAALSLKEIEALPLQEQNIELLENIKDLRRDRKQLLQHLSFLQTQINKFSEALNLVVLAPTTLDLKHRLQKFEENLKFVQLTKEVEELEKTAKRLRLLEHKKELSEEINLIRAKMGEPAADVSKIKVYCYAENINFKNQEFMISYWKQSWEYNGYDPIVLTLEDAQKHEGYEEFLKNINKISLNVSGNPLSRYGLACWMRWLAYASQTEEPMYVSDYDVINHRFKPTPPGEGLWLLDNDCPCLVSGKPSDFEKLCKDVVEVTESNLKDFKKAFTEQKFIHFHDQEFFSVCLGLGLLDYRASRNRKFLSSPKQDDFWKCPLVHYSSAHSDKFRKATKADCPDLTTFRCLIIEKYLYKCLDEFS